MTMTIISSMNLKVKQTVNFVIHTTKR